MYLKYYISYSYMFQSKGIIIREPMSNNTAYFLTLLHSYIKIANLVYTILFDISSLMMIPCGLKHIGILSVIF
jgi:hypothetical protein